MRDNENKEWIDGKMCRMIDGCVEGGKCTCNGKETFI